jgi:hypothetical protein
MGKKLNAIPCQCETRNNGARINNQVFNVVETDITLLIAPVL